MMLSRYSRASSVLRRRVRIPFPAEGTPNVYQSKRNITDAVIEDQTLKAPDLSNLWSFGLFPWKETAPGQRLLIAPLLDLEKHAQVAFECATDGIFNHYLMVKHREQVLSMNPAINSPRRENIFNVASLRDIFHPDLTTFYNYAIERYCSNSKYLCTFELKEITSAKLQDLQLFLGAPNDRAKLTKVSVPLVPYLYVFDVSHLLDHDKIDSVSDLSDEMEKLREKHIHKYQFLMRMCVNVECKVYTFFIETEVFAVTDTESGEVVQGELQPTVKSHKVVFEHAFSVDLDEDYLGWTIVDIDDWLKGNEYWMRDRLVPPR